MTSFLPRAALILVDLAKFGIDVELDGETIRYHPRSAMTAATLERLRKCKNEVLAWLLIRRAHGLGGADLAERVAEAWMERISIITADRIPLVEAERTALEQLRAMVQEETALCRMIEKDQGLPAGSVRLYTPEEFRQRFGDKRL